MEFSSFPTVLLIDSLRLSLNVASTRLILLNGNKGYDAAGSIVRSFGEFVVGGNQIVGIIVFLILVLINFVVITKGAGRIAEVAARFTLDAMPGKQMAIDADLNAGLIDETQARQRRQYVQRESDFYGAMDGASKFVRGDAIAGLIITTINILGGLLIGVTQFGMSSGDAFETYATLTIGDGLVSQIPALIISIAAISPLPRHRQKTSCLLIWVSKYLVILRPKCFRSPAFSFCSYSGATSPSFSNTGDNNWRAGFSCKAGKF